MRWFCARLRVFRVARRWAGPARRGAPLLFAVICGGGAEARTEEPPRREAFAHEAMVTLREPGSAQVLIRGGTFRMGSAREEIAHAHALCELEPRHAECREEIWADEHAAHDVRLSDFWLDRTEVTNAAYRRCVAAGVCTTPGYGAAARWTRHDEHPVTLVSWYDARAYCHWIGGRLPTEAEWERAARGWSARIYPWGNVFNPRIVNHGRFALDALDDDDGFAELAPVASFPQGRTPEGLEDMAGNVEEWVADWYAPRYAPADQVDPVGPPAGDERVLRGGSFQAGRAWLRTAARNHDLPSVRRSFRGFRCARDAGLTLSGKP